MLTDGSTVTVTCSASHGLETGDVVRISESSTYDGDYTITVTSSTQFTFASSALVSLADSIIIFKVIDGVAEAQTPTSHGLSVGDIVNINMNNNTYDESQATITELTGIAKFKYLTDEDDITIIDTPAGEVGQTGKFKSNFINW